MSQSRGRHRHHRRVSEGEGWMKGGASKILAHPWRSAAFGGLGLLFFWLTLTKTLPFALASTKFEFALSLNPSNPVALIAKAMQLREGVLVPKKSAAPQRAISGQRVDAFERLPPAEVPSGGESSGSETNHVRREIQGLATQALKSDPLNAQAFELMASVVDDVESARRLMHGAAARSRHAAAALLWLANDSLSQRDYGKELEYVDLLLKTRPAAAVHVLNYIVRAASASDGFSAVVGVLAGAPVWRTALFRNVPDDSRQTDVLLKLGIALKEREAPLSMAEVTPLLNSLAERGEVVTAFNAWLRLRPADQAGDPGWLNNGNFSQSPSGLAFDWTIARGQNSLAEINGSGPENEGVLHVRLDAGRVRFPEVSQVVVLGPGRYRLEGKVKGKITGMRGVRWQLVCANRTRSLLAETNMLMGETRQWRTFSLDIDLSENAGCVGQKLRLMHDARFESEEFISGEVWFANLRLERVNRGSVTQ
jgi:hypothetical protein